MFSYQNICSNRKPDKVYMQDLESHLRYSFWNEIGSKASLSANELQGLKYHMRILSKVRAYLIS